MTSTKCRQAEEWMDAALDALDESGARLNGASRDWHARLQDHLSGCPTCRKQWEVLCTAERALRAPRPVPTPDGLLAQFRNRLSQEDAHRTAVRPGGFWRWLFPVGSLAACTAAMLFVATHTTAPMVTPDVARSAATAPAPPPASNPSGQGAVSERTPVPQLSEGKREVEPSRGESARRAVPAPRFDPAIPPPHDLLGSEPGASGSGLSARAASPAPVPEGLEDGLAAGKKDGDFIRGVRDRAAPADASQGANGATRNDAPRYLSLQNGAQPLAKRPSARTQAVSDPQGNAPAGAQGLGAGFGGFAGNAPQSGLGGGLAGGGGFGGGGGAASQKSMYGNRGAAASAGAAGQQGPGGGSGLAQQGNPTLRLPYGSDNAARQNLGMTQNNSFRILGEAELEKENALRETESQVSPALLTALQRPVEMKSESLPLREAARQLTEAADVPIQIDSGVPTLSVQIAETDNKPLWQVLQALARQGKLQVYPEENQLVLRQAGLPYFAARRPVEARLSAGAVRAARAEPAPSGPEAAPKPGPAARPAPRPAEEPVNHPAPAAPETLRTLSQKPAPAAKSRAPRKTVVSDSMAARRSGGKEVRPDRAIWPAEWGRLPERGFMIPAEADELPQAGGVAGVIVGKPVAPATVAPLTPGSTESGAVGRLYRSTVQPGRRVRVRRAK